MNVQKLPPTEKRVETGPVQFGDDWPGVFFRGDMAGQFAGHLRVLLDESPDSIQKRVIEGLYDDLMSCIIR